MYIKSKLIIIVLIGALFSISCEELSIEPDTQIADQSFPTDINLELPSAISSSEILKSYKVLSAAGIHNYLRNFVDIGYQTIEVINSSYQRINAVVPQGASEFTYTGLDGKTKLVSIANNVLVDSVLWDYRMEVYNNSFANLALQIFWNAETTEQLIFCNLNLLNQYKMEDHPNAIITIEYNSELGTKSYESSVFIGVSGLTISEQNPYAPNNIKLFFGINNQIIDFIGSSNNPNTTLYNTSLKGKNWSFRGKTDVTKNLAVLELALPDTELDIEENLMLNFSLKNVILQELRTEYNYVGFTDEEVLSDRNIDIANIESPAYFNSEGFQGSGTGIPSEYLHLTDFEILTPFIPLLVKNYEVAFISVIE